MSTLAMDVNESAANPLDVVEHIAVSQDWPYHRESEDELAAEVSGQWCHYKIWFAWHAEMGALHVSAALDTKIPANKRQALHTLLALANEKLWIGHFDMWSEENLPVFRHALITRDPQHLNADLIEDLVDIAIGECERFYPAFQFTLWGGKKPEEAMQAAMLETEGEA